MPELDVASILPVVVDKVATMAAFDVATGGKLGEDDNDEEVKAGGPLVKPLLVIARGDGVVGGAVVGGDGVRMLYGSAQAVRPLRLSGTKSMPFAT